MGVQTTTGIPSEIEAGNEYHFTTCYSAYPVASWTAQLALVLGTAAPVLVSATTSGSSFLFQLASSATAAIAPGCYQYAVYVTSSGQRATAETGLMTVLPNLAAGLAPSFAQQQVTALQKIIAAFNSTDKLRVNFNGQEFQRANIADYQRQLVYWESRLVREQQQQKAARGEQTQGRVDAQFVATAGSPPWPWNPLT